jgi:hypothetical protein
MRQGDDGDHVDASRTERGKASADRRARRHDVVYQDHASPGKGSSQGEGSERVLGARFAIEARLLARVAAAFEEEGCDARSRALSERSGE